MADDVIDRGADGLWKAAIIDVGRNRLLHVDDVIVTDAIELLRRDSGEHVLADHVEHVGCQAAGDTHLFLFVGCLNRDHGAGYATGGVVA